MCVLLGLEDASSEASFYFPKKNSKKVLHSPLMWYILKASNQGGQSNEDRKRFNQRNPRFIRNRS